MSDLTPDGYIEALTFAKKAIQPARTRAVLAVNSVDAEDDYRPCAIIANRA